MDLYHKKYLKYKFKYIQLLNILEIEQNTSNNIIGGKRRRSSKKKKKKK